MKPYSLYQGTAPQTFSMMGQGVAEGMGKIGELYGKGIQSIGQSIASGMNAYMEDKDSGKTIKALEKTADLIQDPQQKSALLGFLKDDNLSNVQKAKMGSGLFNTLIDYGLKAQLQKEEQASRERIAGMRAMGGGEGTGMEPWSPVQ